MSREISLTIWLADGSAITSTVTGMAKDSIHQQVKEIVAACSDVEKESPEVGDISVGVILARDGDDYEEVGRGIA